MKNRALVITLALILLFPLIILFSWFGDGYMLATGEGGLPLYDAARSGKLYSTFWYEIGTGKPTPALFPHAPYYSFLGWIQSLGFSEILIQAATFYVLFVTGMLAVCCLAFFVYPVEKKREIVGLIVAIFYLINPYSMTQVWSRFLNAPFFGFALLPVALLLYVLYSRTRKTQWLLAFVLANLVFAPAYGFLTFSVVLWFVIGSLFVYQIITKEKSRFIIVRSFFTFLIVWLITNSWWYYPYLTFGRGVFSEYGGPKENLSSLKIVSEYTPLLSVVRLIQDSIFFGNQKLNSIYSSFYFSLISWIAPFIIFWSLFHLKQLRYSIYFIILIIIGIFMSTGLNSPFGKIFEWLFINVPNFELFRNPFEKFGLVLILGYSILFGVGLSQLAAKIASATRLKFLYHPIIAVSLIMICGIYLFPMWTGLIIEDKKVRVPMYYRSADNYIKNINNEARILHLPFLLGDGVPFNWDKRYDGEEPSEFLFANPSLSKIIRTKYFDEKYKELAESIKNQEKFERLLMELNVRFLVIHNDFDSNAVKIASIQEARDDLRKIKSIKFLKRIGLLDIYEFAPGGQKSLFIAEGEIAPKISYQKISPAYYRVYVENAQTDFSLIFKNTFNKLWQGKIDSSQLTSHFVVYNYANAWSINKKGNYTIDIVMRVWPWE